MNAFSVASKNIVSIVLGLLVLVGGFYLYTNLWPNYSQAKATLNVTEGENVRLTKALGSIQQFIDTYNSSAALESKANLSLPSDSPDMGNFLGNLEQLAVLSGVTLGPLQVNESTNPGAENAIQSVEVGVSASGSYLSLKDYVLRLQRNLRLVDIYQINIISPQQTTAGGTTILQYQIKLRTYFQQ